MSERPPQLPPPTNPALLPALAAIVYIAAVVALWGILSLLLDREVIDYADAGPLLGPAMVASAGIVTWLVLLLTRRFRSPWPGTVAAAFLVGVAMLVVAAVGYGLVAAPHFAISPFLLGAVALAAITVLVTWVITPRGR